MFNSYLGIPPVVGINIQVVPGCDHQALGCELRVQTSINNKHKNVYTWKCFKTKEISYGVAKEDIPNKKL